MTFMVKPGVEVPSERRTTRKYPFDTIEVGQTFFIPGKTTKQMATYASLQGRRYGKKFRSMTATMRLDLQTDEWEPCKIGAAGSKRGVAITRIL